MKTIISLFDHSHAWSYPFFEQGHDVYPFDLDSENPVDINDFCVEWLIQILPPQTRSFRGGIGGVGD